MNRIIFILTLSAFLFSQQAEVTNIQAAQRTDGSQIVDITYDLLEDEIFEEFTITVEVSFDGGSSFTAISNATGDIGEAILPGLGKSITWNFGQQYSDTYSDQVQYKITAESDAIVVVEDEGCGPVPEGDIPFEMVHVPPGDFTFGENDEVTPLDCNYEIMKYEVTDLEYVNFLMSAMESGIVTVNSDGAWGPYVGDEITSPQESIQYIDFMFSKISWNGIIFELNEGYVNHPVSGVSYYGAFMFAEYYGMELPTEYEWEKAARGNTDNSYPWGDNISHERANYINGPLQSTSIGSYNGAYYESNLPIMNFQSTPNAVWTFQSESTAYLYFNNYVDPICGFQFDLSGNIDNCYAGYWVENGGHTSISSGNYIMGFDFDCNVNPLSYLEPFLICEGNFGSLSIDYFANSSGNTIPFNYVGEGEIIDSYSIQTIDSPSPYGIYDLSGNISEWVKHNMVENDLRMIKGGCFNDNPENLQAHRSFLQTYAGTQFTGFRCIRRLLAEE